jgi:hypothetical protein
VFEGRRKPIRFLKRAQILVADLWACFEGESYGEFRDIDKITMFADYRVPQILNTMGCIFYSPILDLTIRDKKEIPAGGSWELQLRGEQTKALCREYADIQASLQYMVRRANTEGDNEKPPGGSCQRNSH